jgi:hypothetical protein
MLKVSKLFKKNNTFFNDVFFLAFALFFIYSIVPTMMNIPSWDDYVVLKSEPNPKRTSTLTSPASQAEAAGAVIADTTFQTCYMTM